MDIWDGLVLPRRTRRDDVMAPDDADFDKLADEIIRTQEAVARPKVPVYTVETAPESHTSGEIIMVSDGAAGSPILAYSDGESWLRSDDGTEISGAE